MLVKLVLPIWRHGYLIWLVFSFSVEVSLMSPRGSLCGEIVEYRFPRVISVCGIQESQVVEGIIEHGVCDQSTGIVWPAAMVYVQRSTVARFNIGAAFRVALELVDVHRLDVTAVVLIEVGEAVVEKDGRADIVGDLEAQYAHVGLY
jgi:hypothetical protein